MRKTTHKQFLYGDNELLANTAENAYRRGVHQALAMLEIFSEETGASVGEVLPVAVKKASAIRGSSKDAPFLLHYLFEEIKAERQAKAQRAATKKAKASNV